ncbi:MAG TPA: hypothetical protein PKW07_10920 [Syntrophorhabdaceae bacterium]|nr:hypothetical protein [Syntrophorhabdaceae bacterium]
MRGTPNIEISNKISLSFEFVCFNIIIDDVLLSDIGDFTVFCLKAISEGATIDDIASVTLLKADLIDSQLSFVKERGYLSKDNTLTEKGRYLVNILDFKEKYGTAADFCIDAYIDDVGLKTLFKPELIINLQSTKGFSVNPKIKRTRIIRMAYEFVEKGLIEYLKSYFPEQRDFIEKEKDNLSINVRYKCSYNVSLDFTPDEMLEVVSFAKDGDKGISIGVPVLVCESSFSVATNDEDIQALLDSLIKQDESFSKTIVFNLLDGSLLDPMVQTKKKEADDTVYIDKLVKLTDLVPHGENVNILSNLFLFLNIQKVLKERYIVGVISDAQLSSIFQKKIL